MSQRRFVRASKTLSVVAETESTRPSYRTRDISRGGLFLLMEKPWAEGSAQELSLHHGATTIAARVHVVRSTPDGVAVAFDGDQPELEVAVSGVLQDLFGQGAPIDEQRAAPRLATGAPVAWCVGEEALRGRLIDLSLTGAGITAESSPSVGVKLLVQLPEVGTTVSEAPIEAAFGCEAEVVRHVANGFAVRFVGMTAEFRGAITRLRMAARRAR